MAAIIRKVNARLEAEKAALSKLIDLAFVAKIIDIGTYPVKLPNGEIHEAKVLIQEFINGDPLNQFLSKNSRPFNGIPNENRWFELATYLAEALLAVHQKGVIHRDIWPENIMIRDDRPVYIDFGEAVFRDAMMLEEIGKSRRDNAYVAPEWRGQSSWPSRRSDLYSLGGVLYYMACGENPPLTLPSDDGILKEFLARRIREKNPALFQQNPGVPDVILPCLRVDRATRVPDGDALLQKIQTFQLAKKKPDLSRTTDQIAKETRRLKRFKPDFFADLAEIELRQALHRIRDMAGGIRELTGTREEIEWGLTSYLSVLGKGDEYLTITTPQFWDANNLGLSGPYLSMNILLALRGVRIRRVFLITKKEEQDPQFQELAKTHVEMQRRLPEEFRHCLETRYITVDDDDVRKKMIEDGEHYGIWLTQKGALRIFLIYDQAWQLRTVRMLKTDADPQKLRGDFYRDRFDPAKPLDGLVELLAPTASDVPMHSAFPERHIFISYPHTEQSTLDELLEMAEPMIDRRVVKVWHDKMLKPGEKWQEKIAEAMANASVGLVIASAKTFSSKYINNEELPFLISAAEANRIRLVWLAAGECIYETTPLNDYQCLNEPGSPLKGLTISKRKQTLKHICKELHDVYQRSIHELA